VAVAPARLPRWVAGFAERHGSPEITIEAYGVSLVAPDGATAQLHRPPGAPAAGDLAGFVAAAQADRRLGLLLARRGAVAVGVAVGDRLVVSKVDTHYVQGRTAAGGWSQQRFARRRANQARAAAADAADIAARLLLPEAGTLAALVAGGDRGAVDAILADPRLGALAELRDGRLLDVPEPRHAVLVDAVGAARAVRVLVREPGQPWAQGPSRSPE
jgi:Actinobacteria/chloroflexi VLRF1 release factor